MRDIFFRGHGLRFENFFAIPVFLSLFAIATCLIVTLRFEVLK